MNVEIVRRAGGVEPQQPGWSTEGALDALVARLYRLRDAAPEQCDYALTRLLPPDTLLGLPESTALLCDAVQRGRKIVVVGDFDVDGATSTALAVSALRAMGHEQVGFFVPNRFVYGYGLSPAIVEQVSARGAELIITVDNGISSLEGVEAANLAGIDVLVTDHHLPGAVLPTAAAIVNPNQPGCGFPSKSLAGVGVIFYVMTALRSALRQAGWFQQQGVAEPNMARFLDLVALGTVADVVPLDYNNRIFVQQGVTRMRAGRVRPGLAALLRVAGRRLETLVAADLGFALGPRLNAAGRLDDMGRGIRCLLSEDMATAEPLAVELDELNKQRRDIEQEMKEGAVASLDSLNLDDSQLPFGLCLYQPDWHQGVVGIVAARIREKYHRPVIAFAGAGNAKDSDNPEGLIKGSARSVSGFHIRDALDRIAAAQPGLIRKFGGHAMAAGLELSLADYEAFSVAFDQVVREQLSAADLRGQVLSDGELPPSLLGLELAQSLRDSGPWGQHFPEPVFDGEFSLLSQRLVGERHLKLSLAPLSDPERRLDAIWFNVDLAQWPAPAISSARVAFRLDVNDYRGLSSAQLLVDHMQPLSG